MTVPLEETNVTYVQWVQPVCPLGTAVGAYTLTAVPLKTVFLWRMEVRIPAGHQGVTGIALVDSDAFIIPKSDSAPAWLIGDNDLLEYAYNKEIGSNVKLATYNTGSFDHEWEVRLVYTPMSDLDSAQAEITVAV